MIKKDSPAFWHIECNTRGCGKIFGSDTPGVTLDKRRVDDETAALMKQMSWGIDGPRHYCPGCMDIEPLYECWTHDGEAVYPLQSTYYMTDIDVADMYGWLYQDDGKTRIGCVQCQHSDSPGILMMPVCNDEGTQHSWVKIGDTLRCITPLCTVTQRHKSTRKAKLWRWPAAWKIATPERRAIKRSSGATGAKPSCTCPTPAASRTTGHESNSQNSTAGRASQTVPTPGNAQDDSTTAPTAANADGRPDHTGDTSRRPSAETVPHIG